MKRLLASYETFVFLVIVLLCIIITWVNPNFLTLENLFDLLKSYSFVGILAIGVLFVLISGGIDISFTAVATVAMYVMAVIIVRYGGNMLTAFLIASVIGIILGMVNAVIIYFFNIHSIITTIATLNIYYGLLTVFSGGKWIYALPTWFREFTEIRVFTLTNANGIEYGLSIITVIWFALLALAWLILRYTMIGRGIYAMGGNPTSARRVGFDVLRLQLFVYSFMGWMAGIAGVILALLVQTVAPNSIVGKELDVLAAVILGGASLTGGVGSLWGTMLGVALIAIMGNGLTMMRVPAFWYNVFIGLTIVISVSANAYRHKRKKKRAIAVEIE
ncbi:MAG: ABC transporter permease [Chloroflexi bacterium]|nr:MAG: ABC transporter permease [Chloroflexota bacterium]RLC85331.1 MAG: ABC transporter permease [Chloroflexota bacterium]